jgi:hypothetical protein
LQALGAPISFTGSFSTYLLPQLGQPAVDAPSATAASQSVIEVESEKVISSNLILHLTFTKSCTKV